MALYLKIVAAALIAVLLGITTGRDFSVLLSVSVCIMVCGLILELLEPVIHFISELQVTAAISGETGKILLKVVGVGFLSEIASVLCSDAGSDAIGKLLKLSSSVMIVCLSVPLVQSVLSLLQHLLGVL